MMDWIEIRPLDLVSTVAGGLAGLGLVYLVEWLWRPRVKVLGFRKTPSNIGLLYKFRFKLKGRRSPGFCCLRIEWCGRSVLGKWDETPNPVDRDDPNQFRPELVPSTFFVPLLLKQEYSVPIVIEHDGKREIFSGWWFGRPRWGPDPAVGDGARIRLTLAGGDFQWSGEFALAEVCPT